MKRILYALALVFGAMFAMNAAPAVAQDSGDTPDATCSVCAGSYGLDATILGGTLSVGEVGGAIEVGENGTGEITFSKEGYGDVNTRIELGTSGCEVDCTDLYISGTAEAGETGHASVMGTSTDQGVWVGGANRVQLQSGSQLVVGITRYQPAADSGSD